MRTQQEIKTEIKALKKLKPVGPFKEKTSRTIARAIDELEDRGFDVTTEEFSRLPECQCNMILQALEWREGDSDEKPSEGWGALVL